jgi:hypothetical protein
MTEELRKKLVALRAAAPALNKATSEAAAVVAAVEKFLAELSLGLSMHTHVFDSVHAPPAGDEDGEEERRVFYTLAYGRVAGTSVSMSWRTQAGKIQDLPRVGTRYPSRRSPGRPARGS